MDERGRCVEFYTRIRYSYAEVRAEQRRELGIEESPPEVTADLKVTVATVVWTSSELFSHR